jgi:hypothetical protein
MCRPVTFALISGWISGIGGPGTLSFTLVCYEDLRGDVLRHRTP